MDPRLMGALLMRRSALPPAAPLEQLPDYGYGPTTPATRSGNTNDVLTQAQPGTAQRMGQALADYGPVPAKMATAVALQPVTAGNALGEALAEPSIPNATNAAFQTSLAVLKPMMALKSLGLGYGAAAAQDLAPGLRDALVTPAAAKKKAPPAEPVTIPELPGLPPEAQAAYRDAMMRIRAGDFGSGSDRRATEDIANRLRGQSDAIMSEKTAREAREAEQKRIQDAAAYDAATADATAARNKELGRVRRFSDTAFGQVYDKTGGAAAMAAAMLGGAMHNMKFGSDGALNKLVLPALEGTGLAYSANTLPLAYDAFLTPADNPEKTAAATYGRLLPEGHPDKAKATAYGSDPTVPDVNPVRVAASKEFYDQFLERLGISAIEGIPSALTGANLPSVLPRMMTGSAETIGEIPGALATGVVRGTQRAVREGRKLRQLRDTAAQTDAAAAELSAVDRAIGRVSDGRKDLSGRSSAAPAPGPQRPPESAPARPATSLPSPVRQGGENNPMGGLPAQGEQKALADALQQIATKGLDVNLPPELLTAMRAAPPAPVARQLPTPREPGPGKYVEGYQPFARAELDDLIGSGGRLGPKQGVEIARRINGRLPENLSPLSDADVRARVATLRGAIGDTPSMADWTAFKGKLPAGKDTWRGKKVFSVAPLAAGLAGASSQEPDVQDIARALMAHQNGY